jgi:hypothetical protein
VLLYLFILKGLEESTGEIAAKIKKPAEGLPRSLYAKKYGSSIAQNGKKARAILGGDVKLLV